MCIRDSSKEFPSTAMDREPGPKEAADYVSDQRSSGPDNFRDIIVRLRQGELNLATREARQEFIRNYGSRLESRRTRDGRNLLHRVAMEEEHPSTAALARLLTKNYPDFMADQDGNGQTPLHIAFSEGNENAITAMIEAFKEIDEILRIRGRDDQNCLH